MSSSSICCYPRLAAGRGYEEDRAWQTVIILCRGIRLIDLHLCVLCRGCERVVKHDVCICIIMGSACSDSISCNASQTVFRLSFLMQSER